LIPSIQHLFRYRRWRVSWHRDILHIFGDIALVTIHLITIVISSPLAEDMASAASSSYSSSCISSPWAERRRLISQSFSGFSHGFYISLKLLEDLLLVRGQFPAWGFYGAEVVELFLESFRVAPGELFRASGEGFGFSCWEGRQEVSSLLPIAVILGGWRK
jgi:hypothetical protein